VPSDKQSSVSLIQVETKTMANDQIPVTSPVGELHWVNISGQGKQNYNEDGYNYVATVFLGGDKAEALKAKVDDVLGDVPKGKTVKSTGYRKLYKDAEGTLRAPNKDGKILVDGVDIFGDCEETDMYAFQFTTRTTFADGKTKKISVYNKDAKKVELGDRKVGNGSIGAISGKMERFERGKEVGVSLYLNAIQLTKFTEYSGDAGFEAQEGDFESVEDEETGFTGETESEAAAPAKKAKPRL
jgi:hypothetical protein